MLTFIVIFILVLVAADLFVRLIVEPLILRSEKKDKVSKSSISQLDPSFKLATETMYDGGKPHDPKLSKSTADGKNLTEEELNS